MPKWCAAVGCTNESDRPYKTDDPSSQKISFHKFPRDPETRQKWILAINRKDFNPGNHASLCSEHFTDDTFIPGLTRRKLYPNAVPTIFKELPDYQPPPKRGKSSALEEQIVVKSTAVSSEEAPTTSSIASSGDASSSRDAGDTDDTANLRRRVTELKKTFSFTKEIRKLKAKVPSEINEKTSTDSKR